MYLVKPGFAGITGFPDLLSTGFLFFIPPLEFDVEFLRWMLSDGAGAFLVRDRPNSIGISLKIEWLELISHASAYPVCIYAGIEDSNSSKSWLDYPSYSEAAAWGAINLRQNIPLLDEVIKLGIEGRLKLIETGRVSRESKKNYQKNTELTMTNSEIDLQPKTEPPSVSGELLRQLTLVWLEFERQLQTVPIIRR
jgi:hypothetical protein